MPQQYTYAVARIHTKENSMLSIQDMERLLATSDMAEAMAFLSEKGFVVSDSGLIDEIISQERAKMWKLISELVDDLSVFDIFLYENDFHNLKAAVKSILNDSTPANVFVDNGSVPWEKIYNSVKNREFAELPEFMQGTAEKAVKTLMETGDGGLCDVIVDKAYLEACLLAAQKTDSDFIKKYSEIMVAMADIRIAARGSRLGKNGEFFKRSLAECRTINVESLGVAAAKGFDDLVEYLRATDFRDAADVLGESYVAFEKWCDDRLMQEIRKEKHNNFTVAPIAAYILAKESELKAVGLVLTAKQNKLDENIIRERLRELYV